MKIDPSVFSKWEAPSHPCFIVKSEDGQSQAGRWSATFPIPQVGTKVNVTMNRLGEATVTGYLVRHGFIGLGVKFTNPPDWYVKQSGANIIGIVFGSEVEVIT